MQAPVSRIFVAVALAVSSGCAFSVDEGYFFRPRAISQKASSPAGMKLNGEEKVVGPFADDAHLRGRSPMIAAHLPARVSHDLVQLDGLRIAMTRVTSGRSNGSEPLILLCGGNGFDRVNSGVTSIDKVLPWGELIMFDYPGYGDSTGEARMDDMRQIHQAMPAYVDGLSKGRPLVFWGHSLGGLICAEMLRTSREVDAVVLETSAPTSIDLAETRKPFFAPFVKLELANGLDAYDTPRALGGFQGPILVTGAGSDMVIPVQQARNLHDRLKAQGAKVEYHEYAGAHHGNSAMNSQFAADAKVFFERLTDWNH